MKCVFHLGLPKTGTTTLQTHFFPSLPNVLLSLRDTPGPASTLQHVRYLAKDADLLPNGEAGYLAKVALKFRGSVVSETETTLVSNENIVGPHPDGPVAIIRRLHALCPTARIIIVLRHPFDFLRSLYQQEIQNLISTCRRKGETPPTELMNFDSYANINLNLGHAGPFGYLYYDKIVGTLQEHFGSENVLALDFDTFKLSRNDFLRRIAAFIGIKNWVSPTVLGQENVSESKFDHIFTEAVKTGMSSAQLDGLRKNYFDCALSKATMSRVTDFLAQNILQTRAIFSRSF